MAVKDDEILDLDALQAEALGEPYRFKLGGQVFELPAAKDMDWRDGMSLEQGNYEAGLRGLLDDQYQEFAANKLSVDALTTLVQRYAKHLGMMPGESQASAPSSKRTRRR